MGWTVNTGCSHLLSLSCTIMCPRGATASLLDSYLARPPGGWHCDCSGEKKEKERSLFMINWMIKSYIPPNNRKINLPKKFLYCIIRHFPIFQQSTDPSDADSLSILASLCLDSHISSRIVFWDASSRSGFWYQCSVPEQPPEHLIPRLYQNSYWHCVPDTIDTRAAPRVGCISRVQSGL